MKKTIILCGLAVAACGATFAATDQINLIDGGVVKNSIKVDDVKSINYFKAEGSETYSHFCVKYLDGLSKDFAIDDFSSIKYEQAAMVNPLSVEVIPHHYGIELEVSTDDPDAWYRFSGIPESYLAGIDPEDWAEILFEMDVDYINEVAEYYGRPLSSFGMDEIFDRGNVRREWFPAMSIADDTPIALCYYTADVVNDEVVLKSTPRLLRFNTKKLEDVGIRFAFQADLTSTKLNLTVTPEEHENLTDDFTYFVNIYSADAVAASTIQQLIAADLYSIQQAVYLYGASWDELLSTGTSQHQFTNLRTGDHWIAAACGVEMGVGITTPTVVEYVVPEATVTDDCTFEVTASEVSKSEFMLNVVPSNPETRWTAFLVESEKLTDERPASLYVAGRIYNINWMHTYDWTTTEFAHRGEASISTHEGIIDGVILKAGVDYTALIFGIEDDGTRTTEICEVPVKCDASASNDLTFEFTFGNVTGSGNYFRSMQLRVKPSDKTEKYVIESLPASHYAVNDNLSDEELISDYVDIQGQYLPVFTGNATKVFSFGSDYDNEVGDWVFKPYRVFIFGYDGAPTSELYMFEVDVANNVVTQIRGPQPTEE